MSHMLTSLHLDFTNYFRIILNWEGKKIKLLLILSPKIKIFGSHSHHELIHISIWFLLIIFFTF